MRGLLGSEEEDMVATWLAIRDALLHRKKRTARALEGTTEREHTLGDAASSRCGSCPPGNKAIVFKYPKCFRGKQLAHRHWSSRPAKIKGSRTFPCHDDDDYRHHHPCFPCILCSDISRTKATTQRSSPFITRVHIASGTQSFFRSDRKAQTTKSLEPRAGNNTCNCRRTLLVSLDSSSPPSHRCEKFVFGT